MPGIKLILKYLLAVFFILAGLNHFRSQEFYMRMMPPFLPWHLFLVYLSGFAEIALGILLLIPYSLRGHIGMRGSIQAGGDTSLTIVGRLLAPLLRKNGRDDGCCQIRQGTA